MADCRVLVFAKAPIAGQVKTRLCPPLSLDDAAELHRRMLRHTLNAASRADIGPIELCCAPDSEHAFFQQCREEFQIELTIQGSGDLGLKMQRALSNALADSSHALLMGTDCPSITPEYLRAAASSLSRAKPIVFGPAEDGGYGLIGVRETTPEIFTAIPWGSAAVMESTRRILIAKDLAWGELAPIWDVDRPEDLLRLAQHSDLGYLLKGLMPAPVAI